MTNLERANEFRRAARAALTEQIKAEIESSDFKTELPAELLPTQKQIDDDFAARKSAYDKLTAKENAETTAPVKHDLKTVQADAKAAHAQEVADKLAFVERE